jgi:Ca2+-dependent lipid-binding protein
MHFVYQVHVRRAKDLPTADVVGSSDAFVEMTTDGKHVVSTRVIPDSLNPVC